MQVPFSHEDYSHKCTIAPIKPTNSPYTVQCPYSMLNHWLINHIHFLVSYAQSLTHLHISWGLVLTIHNVSNGACTSSRTSNLHLQLLVRICNRAIITIIIRAIMTKSVHAIHGWRGSGSIESCLAMLHAALTVGGFGRTRGRFLLFDFFVRNSLGNNVGEKLEIIKAGYCIC